MKKILSFLVSMLIFTALAAAQYNSKIHFVQGGAEFVAESGSTVTIKSGAVLTADSGAILNFSTAASTNHLNISGALTAGTAVFSTSMAGGAVSGTTANFTGNTHIGAAGYISTFTAASGNFAAGGAISAAGAIAAGAGLSGTTLVMSGAISGTTGNFIGGVTISTSATSSLQCVLLGAVVSLPTGTYHECDKVYQISDHTLYIATETVKAATSWKAVW